MTLPLVLLVLWSLLLNHGASGAHLFQHGLAWLLTSRDPEGRPEVTTLEARVARAQRNHLENLVVFLPLAVLVAARGEGPWDGIIVWAFLAARVAHLLFYAGGVPPLRSLSHAVGLGAVGALLLRLLGALG